MVFAFMDQIYIDVVEETDNYSEVIMAIIREIIKKTPAKAGDKRCRFDTWVGKIPWCRNGNPLHSCLENSMDEGAWQATVRGVAKSWIRLSEHTESSPNPDLMLVRAEVRVEMMFLFCFYRESEVKVRPYQ